MNWIIHLMAGAFLAMGTITAQAAENRSTGAKSAADAAVFGFDKLHKLHLTMSAREWEAMQPAGPGVGAFFGGFDRQRGPAEKAPDGRPTHRSNMMEYPIARADLVEEGGRTYTNVAVRYKGNFTYMASAQSLKRSLKIDFRPDGSNGPEFHGLRKINLHAGVLDPTRQREALAYAVFRGAGVPAPRTAFVELTLTVPGKYDREYVGLYTLVEQVDAQFLKEHFTNAKGLLLKPQGVRGPEYLGESWDEYEKRYQPDRAPAREETKRIIAFSKWVSQAGTESFRREIDAYLDVDNFLRFLGASAMLVNLDSPLAMPQNFYLYLEAPTGRFKFMPWDLDLALAAWPMGGPAEQQMDLSLMHPHVGKHPLIDQLLAIPEVREKYQRILKELAAGCFARELLLKNIEVIETTTKEALAKEAKAIAARPESGGGFNPAAAIAAQAPLPRTFVEKRTESIQAQLAGTREGYVPKTSFGFPGGAPGGPRGPRGPRGGRAR